MKYKKKEVNTMSKLRIYQTEAAVKAKKVINSRIWGNGFLDSGTSDDGLFIIADIVLGKKGHKEYMNKSDSYRSDAYWIKLFKENKDKILKVRSWLPTLTKKINPNDPIRYAAILGIAYIWSKARFGRIPKMMDPIFIKAAGTGMEMAKRYDKPSVRRAMIRRLIKSHGFF